MPTDPVSLLRRHLGHTAFRPGQEELVRAVLAGRDALGVLPTGGGKSVCYQVPALSLRGLTLVVTPLVSLMEDQVGRALGAGLRAAHLSASQEAIEKRATLRAAVQGRLDVLFVAPERLEVSAFREVIERADVKLLAVDEAHCISEWGHDFRPAYRRIGRVRAFLRCPTLALTATATPAVRREVVESLRLRDALEVVRSFDRPNLSWAVRGGRSVFQRAETIYRVLRRSPGCAIVYAPTRRSVERVRHVLADRGVRTEAYHAGLPGAERTRVQEAFMAGRCRVVVATNAFGMGVDKPDVRTVVHVQLPGTLEAYYQEAGRAGRDGEPARCLAFHARRDRRFALELIDHTHPPSRALLRVHRRLRDASGDDGALRVDSAAHPELAEHLDEWLAEKGTGVLAALERTGAVRRISSEVKPKWGPTPRGLEGMGTAAPLRGSHCERIGVRAEPDLALAVRLRRRALDKLDAVQRYARSAACRRRTLLGYFGEEAPVRCGSCDVCVAPPRKQAKGRTG